MPNIRILLWFTLIASLWLSYTTWMQEREPAVAVAPATPATADATTGLDADVPSVPDSDGAVPGLQPADDTSAGNDVGDTIRVRTDVLDVLIATRGGDLVRADLLTYPVEKSNPDVVIRLLDYAPATRWVFQTGLRDAADGPEPNHLAPFKAERSDYVLGPDQSSLTVTLTWAEDSSLAVTKNYTFRRGDYGISLDIDVTNNGAAAWTGVGYTQMLRRHDPLERSFMSVDSYSFTGPVLYDGDSYEKLDFDELVAAPQQQTLPNGWYAAIQHHFLAAAVPPPEDETSYEAVARGEEFRLRAVSPPLQVPPAGDLRYSTALFVGPKLQSQLAEISEDLRLTVDYGLLTPIAKPLFWLLSAVHDYVGNWGFAIILVTMLIKLAFYKLTAMSGRSMAKMRKLQPRMKTLQERYKDDRQGLGQAMMELYKREKVNPAAGCLPMVIQMPFFFAFYWVLVESVEMRQAPFMLWINDLSVRDPFFVLPLLMGAAMLFQQRLNPAPPDPVQAKVMQIMPIVFTGMFAFFPAGLVLYWLTNTATSIAQQWRINTLVEREG